MKKILLLGFLLFSLKTFSQQGVCDMDCSGITVTFSGGLASTGNTNFNSNVCFTGTAPTASITGGVNWNNWTKLGFKSLGSNFIVNKDINMNGNKKVYFRNDLTGTFKVNNISMSGTDTIYCDNNLEILNLISNNSLSGGKANVIMLSSPSYTVKVNGVEYSYGDTILTGGGAYNNVIVGFCPGILLNLNTLELKVKKYTLYWDLKKPEISHVEASEDGKEFIRLRSTSETFYPIEGKYTFYRVRVASQYSNVVKVIPILESKYYYLNLQGQKVNLDLAPQGLYIKVYENGYREKIFK